MKRGIIGRAFEGEDRDWAGKGQYVTALLDLIGNRHQWKPGLQFSPRIVVKETNMDINFLVKVY